MNKFILVFTFFIILSFANKSYAACNWKSKNPQFTAWDTCNVKLSRKSVNAYISFQNAGCLKYKWTVNNTVLNTTSNIMTFAVTQNGTYNICVKVTDTCNKCDTTYCTTKTISCFSSCNWKSKNPQFTTWDSCNGRFGRKSVNAYISFQNSGCFKYQWKVNNSLVSSNGNIMSYTLSQNGTYNICVKVTDTCNNCDTTYCTTKTINCFSGCNWKSKNPQFTTWDSCNGRFGRKSVNAYISFQNAGCFKYQWSVNNTVLNTTSNIMSFAVTQNGTYSICVKVTDTCNKCDTTYCTTKTISCFSSCNWKSKNPQFTSWDSCNGRFGRKSVNAYISFQNAGCFKYQWKVNNSFVSSNGNIMSYTLSQNGTYNICVKVTDTCNKCDTTYCTTKTISCFSSCNWKSKNPQFTSWDSCNGRFGRKSVNAYISFQNSGCFKYQWKVNNSLVSSNGNIMSYTITQNGTYNICVKVTDTCNKCDTTYCTTKTINCFNSKVINNKYDEIKIYPNPANKYITIENKANSFIVIYNILGEKVYSSTLPNTTNSISVENWTKGVYIIQIEHSGVKKTQKIIIN